MVCIAAFIILGLIALFIPVIRIFNKKMADNIWKLFKKSMHCFSRRVTLRKCDSNFKDDIKNSILKRTVLKHPNWTKPISFAIEVLSVLIVILALWSTLVAVRSLTLLTAYGTCEPSDPKSCVLSSGSTVKACTIGETGPEFFKDPIGWTGNWFGQWGAAIAQIPSNMKNWDAKEYLPNSSNLSDAKNAFYAGKYDSNKPVALDVFEPGCTYCRLEFNNQLASDFFAKNNVAIIPYVKAGDKNGHEFENSYVFASYIEAVRENPLSESELSAKNEKMPAVWLLISRLMLENDPQTNHPWQDTFGSLDSNTYGSFGRLFTQDQAREELNKWLADFGYSTDKVKEIAGLAKSDKIKKTIDANIKLVDEKIQAVSLPTVIANGQRKSGLQ